MRTVNRYCLSLAVFSWAVFLCAVPRLEGQQKSRSSIIHESNLLQEKSASLLTQSNLAFEEAIKLTNEANALVEKVNKSRKEDSNIQKRLGSEEKNRAALIAQAKQLQTKAEKLKQDGNRLKCEGNKLASEGLTLLLTVAMSAEERKTFEGFLQRAQQEIAKCAK